MVKHEIKTRSRITYKEREKSELFIEIYYKFGDVDIVIRNMENRIDIVRNHKIINRIEFMSHDDFEKLLDDYRDIFGPWYRAIGEDLPEVIWNGK